MKGTSHDPVRTEVRQYGDQVATTVHRIDHDGHESIEMSTHSDPRFTIALIADIFAALEKHGYRRPELELHAATGAAVAGLLDLVCAFEGQQ